MHAASEILAGALHDNRRAEVIGDPTFGKGKIQSVFELHDGSALFVTGKGGGGGVPVGFPGCWAGASPTTVQWPCRPRNGKHIVVPPMGGPAAVAKYKTPDNHEIDKVGVRPDAACRPTGPAAGVRQASLAGIPIGPGADESVILELESDGGCAIGFLFVCLLVRLPICMGVVFGALAGCLGA